VTAIRPDAAGFVIETGAARYLARNVLLAIGRRGTPRKLEVPGEHLNKVAYRLLEPEQYAGRRVLVVGGGDSAIEAATAISAEPDTDVTLSYRSEAFSRVKPANRERIEAAVQENRVRIFLQSQVVGIAEDHVRVALPDKEIRIPNDAVIISAGGILPSAFLKSVGIRFETKFGTA
jgi:thioredoxin reductase